MLQFRKKVQHDISHHAVRADEQGAGWASVTTYSL